MICPYDPIPLADSAIGMFHCPLCGEMVIAGMHHPDASIEPVAPINLRLPVYPSNKDIEALIETMCCAFWDDNAVHKWADISEECKVDYRRSMRAAVAAATIEVEG